MKMETDQTEMIAAAKAMVPTLLERARAAEENRAVPRETFDEFSERGFSAFTSRKNTAGEAGISA